jgi:hypothetical protein
MSDEVYTSSSTRGTMNGRCGSSMSGAGTGSCFQWVARTTGPSIFCRATYSKTRELCAAIRAAANGGTTRGIIRGSEPAVAARGRNTGTATRSSTGRSSTGARQAHSHSQFQPSSARRSATPGRSAVSPFRWTATGPCSAIQCLGFATSWSNRPIIGGS